MGKAERALSNLTRNPVEPHVVGRAWSADHCPAVFTGPDHAGAHFGPTGRKIEGGHVLNIDFGVKVDGYCSDLQRTWYIRRKGETAVPTEVQRGFNVIRDSVKMAADALKPGVISLSLIHISEPTNPYQISYAVFCLTTNTSLSTSPTPTLPLLT